MRRQLVDLAKQPVPWTLPQNRLQTNDQNNDGNKAQSISWFVYGGLLDLHAATASLLEIFPDEHAKERNYVDGRAPLAVIVLDAEGRPIPGRTFLASYSWGYEQVLANALQNLAEFSSVEPIWRARIEKEILEYAADGKIRPVTPERLRSFTRWLIQELNVPEHQVELDGVAIRVVQSGATSEPPEPELLNSFICWTWKELSCKTSQMSEKELWVYLLAYNLTRLLMAQAADIHPRPRGETSNSSGLDQLLETLAEWAKSLKELAPVREPFAWSSPAP